MIGDGDPTRCLCVHLRASRRRRRACEHPRCDDADASCLRRPDPPHGRAAPFRAGALAAVLFGFAASPVSQAALTFHSDPQTFAAAATNLTLEDFEEANTSVFCSDPFDSTTSDACWQPGGVSPRLSVASTGGGGLIIYGPPDPPSKGVKATTAGQGVRLGFSGNTLAAAADVYGFSAATEVSIAVYGPGDIALGSTTVSTGPAGQFAGVTSTTPIAHIDVTITGDPQLFDEFVDDVRYGPVLDADLRITQDVVEGPPGTLTHTFIVTNQGQSPASGVVASDAFPAQLAYVSDDCGGVNGLAWTWTIGPLAAGANVQCHVTTSIVTSGVVFTNVGSIGGNEPEPSPGDNSATAWLAPGLSSYYTDATAFTQAAGAVLGEDFEEGKVAPEARLQCFSGASASTNNDCFSTGDIVPHLSLTTDNFLGTAIAGPGFFGNASTIIGAQSTASPPAKLRLAFPDQETTAVGFDVFSSEAGGKIDVSVFDADDFLLGKTVVVAAPAGTFVGFATLQPIDHVVVTPTVFADPYVDNIRFGPVVDTDLAVTLSGDENPGGTMKVTVAVYNNGVLDATNVAVSLGIPAALAYVSDDCGGANAPAWTWTGFSVPHGEKSVCHIVTNVVVPQGFAAQARIDAADQPDPVAANDKTFWIGSATGAGPSTPESGFALFRPFADLAFKDQNGAAFSLRDHADQVILLQVCAQWCVPCQQWTAVADDLQAAVEQRIGTGHFLDVDMLVQNGAAGPSTQATATTWKNTFGYPGTVLHAEGSKNSPLWKMVDDLSFQYADVPAQFGFPDFFILAPACENQIAVRGTPVDIQLGEERRIDTSTVDEMATLIADVWQQHPCAQPLLHRIDRCSAGAAPILSVPQDGTSVESAESFSVPDGDAFDIGYVTAITDASLMDFAIYADAGGFPGATACTSSARAATAWNAPNVKKFRLEPACKLGSGDYWLSLKARAAPSSDPLTWFGGVLPRDVPFALRDAQDTLGIGCTGWTTGGSCLGGEQDATELCFMLEPDDTVFHDGFESGP